MATLYGPKRTLSIWFVNLCDFGSYMAASFVNPDSWRGGYDQYDWTDSSTLQIEVQCYEPYEEGQGRGDMVNREISPSQGYAIPEANPPSLDELEAWVLKTTQHWRRPFFASGIHGTFYSLALRYTQCKEGLPLVSAKAQLQLVAVVSFHFNLLVRTRPTLSRLLFPR